VPRVAWSDVPPPWMVSFDKKNSEIVLFDISLMHVVQRVKNLNPNHCEDLNRTKTIFHAPDRKTPRRADRIA
jgi:hypothetical protein